MDRCDPGEFSDQGSTPEAGACAACPVDTYAEKQGFRGACTPCPPGSKSGTRSTDPDDCVHEYKLLATTAALERGYCTGKDLEGAGNRSREVDFKPIHTEEGCRAYFDSLASTAEKSYTYTRGQQQAPDSGVLGGGAA